MRFPRQAYAIVLLFMALSNTPAQGAASGAELPIPLGLPNIRFGMAFTEAHRELPEADLLEPGLDFGPIRGRLVLQRFTAFSSSFRVILQFDREDALRQILLERRHAAATPPPRGRARATFSRP